MVGSPAANSQTFQVSTPSDNVIVLTRLVAELQRS
jgi:hypothetical protein